MTIDPDQFEAERLLRKAQQSIEGSFDKVVPWVDPGMERYLAPTGQKFVEIVSGDRGHMAWPTVAEAIEAWCDRVLVYAAARKGTLYWRIEPEIGLNNGSRASPKGWRVYSRLLISDKPVISVVRQSSQQKEVDCGSSVPGAPRP